MQNIQEKIFDLTLIQRSFFTKKSRLGILAQLFRIAMPKAILRYAGGRSTRLSLKTQELGLKAGINCMLSGDYLTTEGVELKQDRELIQKQLLNT